jgi:hypothetical protein
MALGIGAGVLNIRLFGALPCQTQVWMPAVYQQGISSPTYTALALFPAYAPRLPGVFPYQHS